MILGLLTLGSLIWYLVTARPSGDLKLIGTVDANEVLVSAKIPGRIQTLNVEEGQDVKAGDLIAVIESDDLAAAQKAAEANVQSQQSKLTETIETAAADARRDFQRDDQCRGAGEARPRRRWRRRRRISNIRRPTRRAPSRWPSREL